MGLSKAYMHYTSGKRVETLADVGTYQQAWDFACGDEENFGPNQRRKEDDFPIGGIVKIVEAVGLPLKDSIVKNLGSVANCLLSKGGSGGKTRSKTPYVLIQTSRIIKRFKPDEQSEALEKIRKAYCSGNKNKSVRIPKYLDEISKNGYKLNLTDQKFLDFLKAIKKSKRTKGTTEEKLASVVGEKYVSWIASPDNPDNVKKWLKCLGCGKRMWTDRCHRICPACDERNAASARRPRYSANLPSRTVASFE